LSKSGSFDFLATACVDIPTDRSVGYLIRGGEVVTESTTRRAIGENRVIDPAGVLPQAANRLDTNPALREGETRVRVDLLNLDAASFRQLWEKHAGNGAEVRSEALAIISERGKMHNPVTGSGGTLLGTVEEVKGAGNSLAPGTRVAALVSLTLTPLVIEDALRRWDGMSPLVPTSGYAIFFSPLSLIAVPNDLPDALLLSVIDVSGAPALTAGLVSERRPTESAPSVLVIGAAGKSGSLSAVAARNAGAATLVGVVFDDAEANRLQELQIFDSIVIADARLPIALADAVGRAFDLTVVCVDTAGCEHGSILATAAGGTVVFFSMATSFSAAALGAEGIGADVRMLIGNGFVPGHAALALELVNGSPLLRAHLEERLDVAAR
jgi:L-erythro-3,5-diaminohexanoate dehydrogenase